MIKIGDTVSVLDDDITGKVVSVKGKEITIDTEDGFKRT